MAGRQVSAMSLGTVQLGLNYGIANNEGKPGREKSFSILSAAADEGITALDTARAYGDSEEVLGAFFRTAPGLANKIFITTKLSSGLPAGSSASEVEKALVQSVETSLSNLGLPKTNCLLLHSAADMTIHGPAVAKTLERLVLRGLTDMAGVSVYHPAEVDQLLLNEVYRAVQLPMNVFDLRFQKTGAIERLASRGVKVFVRSVFFQGLLFLDPDAESAGPGNPGGISGARLPADLVPYAASHLRKLRRLSDRAGMSIAQFAITFLRDMPGITSLVLGADNPDQVKQNSALFESPALNESLRHEAEDAFVDLDYPGVMSVLSRPKA